MTAGGPKGKRKGTMKPTPFPSTPAPSPSPAPWRASPSSRGTSAGWTTFSSTISPRWRSWRGAGKELTLRHLLTHTSGLEWREWTGPTNWMEFQTAENWVDYILGRQQVAQPGAVFNYSTGNTHLLAAAPTGAPPALRPGPVRYLHGLWGLGAVYHGGAGTRAGDGHHQPGAPGRLCPPALLHRLYLSGLPARRRRRDIGGKFPQAS